MLAQEAESRDGPACLWGPPRLLGGGAKEAEGTSLDAAGATRASRSGRCQGQSPHASACGEWVGQDPTREAETERVSVAETAKAAAEQRKRRMEALRDRASYEARHAARKPGLELRERAASPMAPYNKGMPRPRAHTPGLDNSSAHTTRAWTALRVHELPTPPRKGVRPWTARPAHTSVDGPFGVRRLTTAAHL